MADTLRDDYHTFYTTGKVVGMLLRQFDQRGKWVGKENSVPTHIIPMLSRTTLSKNQIEEKGPNGQISLKTSFIDQSDQPSSNINYHHIEGNIYIHEANSLIAENLLSCKNFYADRTKNIVVPNLIKVEGNFLARDCVRLEANKLEEITQSLHLDKLRDIVLNSLESIGTDAIASGAKTLTLPKLKEIKKCLYIPQASNIVSPKLKEIGSLDAKEMSEENLLKLFYSLNAKTLYRLLKNESSVGNIKSELIHTTLQKAIIKRAIKEGDQDLGL
jgi:hypothetical protein